MGDDRGSESADPWYAAQLHSLPAASTWLNGERDSASAELAVAYATYGNEPGSDCLYTEVALLVHGSTHRFMRRER